MTGDHSSKQYDLDLEAIRSKVLLMGGLVETQFRDAMECFRTGDMERAERVIKSDQSVNQLELTLDEACNQLIVKRQPAANDLRGVMATVKMITDLERVGDKAVRIARSARAIHGRGAAPQANFDVLRNCAELAGGMLHDALDAYARLDDKQALELIARDQLLNQEFQFIMRNLITYMMEDPRTITSALDTLWVAKAIERIGDHAKNISEHVVFVVSGKDIRHSDPLGAKGEN